MVTFEQVNSEKRCPTSQLLKLTESLWEHIRRCFTSFSICINLLI